MKTSLIILLLVASFATKAQQAGANLVWNVASFKEHPSQTRISRISAFETKSDLVLWVQKAGTFVYEFTVTGTNGTWSDTNVSGEIVYHVLFRGHPGIIRFSRSDNEILIEPDIKKDGINMLPYTFYVSTISSK